MGDYISIMDIIKRAHALKNALPCMKFDFSENEYLGFWYAEEMLYVIRDCMTQALFLEEARSPKEAIEKVLRRVEEAEHAGEPVAEEYE